MLRVTCIISIRSRSFSSPLAARVARALFAAATAALLLASTVGLGSGADSTEDFTAVGPGARQGPDLLGAILVTSGLGHQDGAVLPGIDASNWRWLALALAFLFAVAALLRHTIFGKGGAGSKPPVAAALSGAVERSGSAGPGGGILKGGALYGRPPLPPSAGAECRPQPTEVGQSEVGTAATAGHRLSAAGRNCRFAPLGGGPNAPLSPSDSAMAWLRIAAGLPATHPLGALPLPGAPGAPFASPAAAAAAAAAASFALERRRGSAACR